MKTAGCRQWQDKTAPCIWRCLFCSFQIADSVASGSNCSDAKDADTDEHTKCQNCHLFGSNSVKITMRRFASNNKTLEATCLQCLHTHFFHSTKNTKIKKAKKASKLKLEDQPLRKFMGLQCPYVSMSKTYSLWYYHNCQFQCDSIIKSASELIHHIESSHENETKTRSNTHKDVLAEVFHKFMNL